jgi:hypothetical protein
MLNNYFFDDAFKSPDSIGPDVLHLLTLLRHTLEYETAMIDHVNSGMEFEHFVPARTMPQLDYICYVFDLPELSSLELMIMQRDHLLPPPFVPPFIGYGPVRIRWFDEYWDFPTVPPDDARMRLPPKRYQ